MRWLTSDCKSRHAIRYCSVVVTLGQQWLPVDAFCCKSVEPHNNCNEAAHFVKYCTNSCRTKQWCLFPVLDGRCSGQSTLSASRWYHTALRGCPTLSTGFGETSLWQQTVSYIGARLQWYRMLRKQKWKGSPRTFPAGVQHAEQKT